MPKPIRVLHVITRLIVGGAQENTMLTSAMLDPARFAVDLVSGPQTGPEGSLIEQVRARGVPLTILPSLVRQVNPLQDLHALFSLWKFMRRGRYAIVHTHSSKAGILGRVAAWLAGVPIIIHTVHGWGFHDHMGTATRLLYVCLEKLVEPMTDRLVVVSPRNTEKGLKAGIASPDKYLTIRSGIDIDRFAHPRTPAAQVRASLGIPASALVVITVTRLVPQKAPLDFLAAASRVAERVPHARFLVVGDGPMRAQVERAIQDMGLAERVVLTGLRRDVPDLLGAADVFVLSSLWEGLPRVILQAMAAGKPVVVTAADGNAEVVQDGSNGLLVPPGMPAELAKGIVTLLSDPVRSAEMGRRGQHSVLPFDRRKMVSDIERLYLDLMQKSRRAEWIQEPS